MYLCLTRELVLNAQVSVEDGGSPLDVLDDELGVDDEQAGSAPIPPAGTVDRASWGRTADAQRGQAQTVQALPGAVDEGPL